MCRMCTFVLEQEREGRLNVVDAPDRGKRDNNSNCPSAAGDTQPPSLFVPLFSLALPLIHSFLSLFSASLFTSCSPCLSALTCLHVPLSPALSPLLFSSPLLLQCPPPLSSLSLSFNLCLGFSLWLQHWLLLYERQLANYDAGERLHAGHCDCQLRG